MTKTSTESQIARSDPRTVGLRPTTGRRLRFGAVAAVLALVAVGCSGDDDDADAPTQAELDAAVARADAAEAELDDAVAEAEAATSDLETAEEDLAEQTAALETANSELETAVADLDEAVERAETAEARVAEIEEVAGQFPIQLDSSLIPDDMPGTYSINFQEAYCDPGFVLCGTTPQQNVAEIYFDDDEFLRIRVDDVLDAGLFALDGSLYGITDATSTLPSCSGAERRARVTVTMFAGSVSVLEDGTRVVDDVNASITLDAPGDGGDCPGGLQFFASTLTKQGG